MNPRVRTFILLEPSELKFVRTLQRLMEKRSKSRSRPTLSGVIRAIVADYQRVLEMTAAPEFLEAYEHVKSRRKKLPLAVE
jgi:hypothetical protein